MAAGTMITNEGDAEAVEYAAGEIIEQTAVPRHVGLRLRLHSLRYWPFFYLFFPEGIKYQYLCPFSLFSR